MARALQEYVTHTMRPAVLRGQAGYNVTYYRDEVHKYMIT